MKCVFIINPHAGEADNEEKIRREAAGRPVLLVTHDAEDAAALEAEVVQL